MRHSYGKDRKNGEKIVWKNTELFFKQKISSIFVTTSSKKKTWKKTVFNDVKTLEKFK